MIQSRKTRSRICKKWSRRSKTPSSCYRTFLVILLTERDGEEKFFSFDCEKFRTSISLVPFDLTAKASSIKCSRNLLKRFGVYFLFVGDSQFACCERAFLWNKVSDRQFSAQLPSSFLVDDSSSQINDAKVLRNVFRDKCCFSTLSFSATKHTYRFSELRVFTSDNSISWFQS